VFICGLLIVFICLLGLLFNPGDANDLAAKVAWAWSHEKEMQEMGKAARREFELKYTAERNYKMLMGIYERAIAGKR
jgi:glycosyltransferase involved in cell wall biosynthesis